MAPLLAADFRVVMADLRGHGWSDAPADDYEKERLAADMIGLLDALELDRVGYIGHDWGAFVGYLTAFAAPERIRALLTLSIPHPWPSRHDRLNPWRLAAFAYQLPLASPLWTHPKVTITPHNAAASDPRALVANVLRQLERFEAGLPLEQVLDRATGY